MIDFETIQLDKTTIDNAYRLMESNIRLLKNYLKSQKKEALTICIEEISAQIGVSPVEVRDSAAVLLHMGFIQGIDQASGGKVTISL